MFADRDRDRAQVGPGQRWLADAQGRRYPVCEAARARLHRPERGAIKWPRGRLRHMDFGLALR
jgi:hypothetical protein